MVQVHGMIFIVMQKNAKKRSVNTEEVFIKCRLVLECYKMCKTVLPQPSPVLEIEPDSTFLASAVCIKLQLSIACPCNLTPTQYSELHHSTSDPLAAVRSPHSLACFRSSGWFGVIAALVIARQCLCTDILMLEHLQFPKLCHSVHTYHLRLLPFLLY